jgi:Transposase
MKKLGSIASLLPQFDNDHEKVIAWAKEQAAIMTREESESAMKVAIELSEAVIHDKGEQFRFNAGYLFLQKIYHQLDLNKICRSISDSNKCTYDLSDILAKLIYTRIIAPSSKLSSFDYAKNFLEQPNFELHQIYRALDVLAEYSDEIQAEIYKNSLDVIDRSKKVLYYDCTNYFFELEEADGLKQYGKSKENRSNPIVQMGLFMDGNGLPLTFSMFPGNENEQPSLKPLEQKILKDFGLSRFVVCTDAGLASAANRKFNNKNDRSYIVTQSLKTMKSHLKDWAIDNTGWSTLDSDLTYDLSKIDEEIHKDTIFFKERWINENGLEQRLIITFSLKHRNYQRAIRNRQVERAENIIEKGAEASTRNANSPKRFIDETNTTTDGEIAEKKTLSLNESQISKEEQFDGFYGVCTTLEDDITDIIAINRQRWQIEAAFRTMKSEFKARPVYLHNDNRIEAHFLTCFLSLLILRILEQKIGNEYTCEELIHTLRAMDLHKVKGFGYLSSYTRTDLTDKIHETFGFRTDIEFISDKTMKKILKDTKS